MKNSNFIKNSIIALLPISLALAVIFGIQIKPANVTDAYTGTSLSKMDIDLNDTPSNAIRSYYSALNSLSTSQKKGTNLLKNLKTILMKNQKYYNYDSGDTIWRLYEIIDRDWEKSPAKSAPNATYDSINNVLKNYTFKYSTGNDAGNPYLHALYVNRDATNLKRAWGDHGNRNSEATIEREHVWPKSHGFDDEDSAAGGARGDPMHLWAADGTANGNHSNYFYGYVDTSKSYTDSGDKFSSLKGNLLGTSKTIGGTSKVFEPQDSDKGDIARACFYMVARYNNYANETTGIDVNNPNLRLSDDINSRNGTSTYNDPYDLGILTDLLEWNKIDPPDEFEIHRNNLLYTNFTNNRNPFIDFPEWADICFGSSTNSADPVSDPINGEGIVKTLTSISITTQPSKTSYVEDETFSIDGMVVTAKYNDNSTEVITNYSISPSGPLALGTDTITISYEGKTADISIVVTPKSAEKIKYFEKVESNLTGGKYLIVCDDEGVAWKNGTPGSANTLSITHDAAGHIPYSTDLSNAQFTLNTTDGSVFAPSGKYIYQDKDKAGVETSDNPVSNTLSLNDGVLTIRGSGGRVIKCNKNSGNPTFNFYSASSSYSNINIYKYVETAEIIHPTSVSVSPKTATVEIGTSEKLIAQVLPTDAAIKSVRWISTNEDVATVDQTGRVVARSTGIVEIKAISNDSEVDLYDSCIITVPEPIVLDSLEISGNYKTNYYVGDSFSKEGLVVNAVYKQGSTVIRKDDVTDDVEFSEFDSSSSGEKTITVTYGDCEKTFNVEVFDVPVEENTIKIVSSTLGYENGTTVKEIKQDNFAISLGKGTNTSNAPKYYNYGSAIRFYSGNTFTIKGAYKIVSVKLVFSNDDGNLITPDKGSFSETTGIWSNTTSVDNLTFSIGGFGGHRKIAEIHIKYDPLSPAAKELLSISLEGDYQTVFDVGDDFNSTGLVVKAHYNDSSSSSVTPDSVTGANMSLSGEQEITVSYTENGITKFATYLITVNKVIPLDYIELSGSYKTEYFVGDTFNRENLVVTAYYTDNSHKVVTPSSISGYNMSTPSDSQKITVTYIEDGIEASEYYYIKVKNIIPTKLEVSNVEQTKYVVGDTFNKNLTATVTYNNGTVKNVNPTNFKNNDLTTFGTKEVIVEYYEKGITVFDTFEITVAKIMPESIVISGDFSKNFYVDDTFEYDGLIATVTFNNGSVENITPTVSTPDMSTSGEKTVEVSYSLNGKRVSKSYKINVAPIVLTKIELSGNCKKQFFVGDVFSSEGLVVTAKYNNGSSKTVTPASISGYNMNVAGEQTITVTFKDGNITCKATYTITVKALTPIKLTLSGTYKTEYEFGEEFDSTGLVITATYDNGSTKVVTSSSITGYNGQKSGQQTITVTYQENGKIVQNTYEITVKNEIPVLSSINISGSYKIEYEYGENFSSEGLITTAYYSNGSTKEVNPTSIAGYNPTKVGYQVITVTYKENGIEKQTSYQVLVKKQQVDPPKQEANLPIIIGAAGGGVVGLGAIITIICVVLKKKH